MQTSITFVFVQRSVADGFTMDIIKQKTNTSPDLNSNFEMDDSELSLKVWPIVRHKYQKIAFNSYKSDDHETAVLYDSKALSCGFVGALLNNSDCCPINEQSIDETIHFQQNSDNVLFDYLSACVSDIKITKTQHKSTTIKTDDQNQFEELCMKCTQLPKQWNVVQLSQMYNGFNGYATKKDMYTSDAPIKLTLFCDDMSEKRSNRPQSIVLDWFDKGEKGIMSTSYEVYQVMYRNYIGSMKTAEFSKFIQELTKGQSKLVNDMVIWLGPWVTLLSGKVKGTLGREFEAKIFAEVDTFCSSELVDFPDDKQILLSLMARRIDLLDSEKIKQASIDIARTNKECNVITKFLANLSKKTKFPDQNFEYYPCILVVDEILDQLPWELVLPSQEFSRVHSIYLLFYLYEKFKDHIDDGYLKLNVKNGFALINPDNDEKLGDMVQRMGKYYRETFPKWRHVEQTTPTYDDFSQELAKSELFVYSGHGSSLQFFSSAEFKELKHNCVMLLFGCESIAMKPRGSICEASCSSYAHFTTGCPGILGTLTIVTDIWIDLITLVLLTQWIAPEKITHPIIDVCKDDHSKERVNKILLKTAGKRNPNLLQLLCDIRNEKDLSIRMRSAMVFRGLPPYNTA